MFRVWLLVACLWVVGVSVLYGPDVRREFEIEGAVQSRLKALSNEELLKLWKQAPMDRGGFGRDPWGMLIKGRLLFFRP